uniref:OpgC domain-containing protein n=2 Tax=Bradyrhizobium TaxID=374 RepID=UPI00397B908C
MTDEAIHDPGRPLQIVLQLRRRLWETITIRSMLVEPRRDVRLDLFRGLANWLIFLGHIPESALVWFTTRNYGFSEKSERTERAALDCAGCHSNREPHSGLFGRECAACHALASWKVVGFLHPSPTSKDCAQCHQAPPSHYMGHFIMMDRVIAGQEHASVDQCFLCHMTDSFNNIKSVGWMKHH